MRLEKDATKDKDEPVFPFGELPGSIVLFQNTPKEQIDELLDKMMADNSVPAIRVNPESEFCQGMLKDQTEEFKKNFKALIIPIRYTKVFTA